MKIFQKFSKKFKNSFSTPVPVTFDQISTRSFPYYSLPPDNLIYQSDSFESLSNSQISLSETLENLENPKIKAFDKMLLLADEINYSFKNIQLSSIQDNEIAIAVLKEIFSELKKQNFTFKSTSNNLAKIRNSGSRGLKLKKYFK